jgi:Flp pilus assembly pilin Flp
MRAKVNDIYLTLLSVVKGEEGQDLVEYALILGLISVGAVTALGTLGGKLVSYYGYIVARVP